MTTCHGHITLYSPSKRVKLTTPSAEYDEAIAALRCAPTTLRYLKFFAETYSIEEARERRESATLKADTLNLNVFVLNDNGEYEFAGSTGAFNIDSVHKSCRSGLLLRPEFIGKNLTAEVLYTMFRYVFETMGFHRIELITSVENEPMRGWFEKVAGIRQEGVKKDAWVNRQGGWTDVASYALLEREWENEVKGRLEKRISAGRSSPPSAT